MSLAFLRSPSSTLTPCMYDASRAVRHACAVPTCLRRAHMLIRCFFGACHLMLGRSPIHVFTSSGTVTSNINLARLSSLASTNTVTASAGSRGLPHAARCDVLIAFRFRRVAVFSPNWGFRRQLGEACVSRTQAGRRRPGRRSALPRGEQEGILALGLILSLLCAVRWLCAV